MPNYNVFLEGAWLVKDVAAAIEEVGDVYLGHAQFLANLPVARGRHVGR